jgi:hypothetical protein
MRQKSKLSPGERGACGPLSGNNPSTIFGQTFRTCPKTPALRCARPIKKARADFAIIEEELEAIHAPARVVADAARAVARALAA